MTDVVQNAMKYRQQLLENLSRIDDFLRIGEHLLRSQHTAQVGASAGATPGATQARPKVAPVKPEKAAAAAPSAPSTAPVAAEAPGSPDAPAQTPEAAPSRSLAFRGAFETDEPPMRRSTA